MSQHGFRTNYRTSVREDATMDLFIETLTGTAFEMTVSPFDTVMSVKSKIQRVEGIPISHQHLLYKLQELDDSSCLKDYSIQDGATLKLVLSMRGGPISTRRLPSVDDCAWRELRDFVESNREDMFDHLPPGCRVTVLVFRDGDQVNLFRVIEHDDGTYSPLSESWSGSSIRNLFAEDDPEEAAKKIHENSVTMGKMRDLRNKMEAMTLQRKPKKSAPRVLSAKKSLLHVRKGAVRFNKPSSPEHWKKAQARASPNFLQLPSIKLPTSTSGGSYLTTSSIMQSQTLVHQDTESQILGHENNISDRNSEVLGAVKKETKASEKDCEILPMMPNITKQKSNKCLDYSNTTQSVSAIVHMQGSGDYGRGKPSSVDKRRSELKRTGKQSLNHVTLTRSKSTNVLGPSNIAIVEEDGGDVENGEPDFSTPPNAIPVPSKEATTYTISQVPRERISSVSSGRYRVSHIVLNDQDRPKTSPEKLSQNEKSTQEMWGILTDTKWHRHRRRRCTPHCSSNLEPFNCLPLPAEQKKQNLSFNKRDTDDRMTVLGDTISEMSSSIKPRYGRRSIVQNLAGGEEKDKFDKHEKQDFKSLRQTKTKVNSSVKVSLLQMATTPLPKLPQESIKEGPTNKKPTVRTRCAECKRKLNITNVYTCRCGKVFCSAHRYSELHSCTYDYKSEGRKLLEQANPLVTAPKLPKI